MISDIAKFDLQPPTAGFAAAVFTHSHQLSITRASPAAQEGQMVVFILAAAGAFLLCVLLDRAPDRFKDWLSKNAHVLRLYLFILFLMAVFLILVAVSASPRRFGTILPALAIFFLASVLINLVYVLVPKLGALRDDSVPSTDTGQANQIRPSFAWLRFFVILILILTVLFVIPADFTGCRPGPIAIAIFSCMTDAWAYEFLLTTRRIASMPETVHAVLGVVAGLMCGNFTRWMTYTRSFGATSSAGGLQQQVLPGMNQPQAEASTAQGTSETWPMIIFAAALASVVIAALMAPYASSTLSRVSGLETPYVKVQFAISPSPAERQQILNVERDLNNIDTLEAFPRSLRFIQYDCAQAALDANMGITEFRLKQPGKYREFTAGLAFRLSVIPYVNRIVNAKRKGYNLVVLKTRARQVAEKFALLATNGDFEKNYLAAMFEVDRQEQMFRDEDVRSDRALKELDRKRRDPDPDYCLPSYEQIDLAFDRFNLDNASTVRMVVQKRPRLILGFAAALFSFEGNVDAANAMFTGIFRLDQSTNDTNAIASFADALYVGGDDLREVLAKEEDDLRLIENRLRQVEAAKFWTQNEVKADPTGARETDNKAHNDLVDRNNRARFIIRLRLAYIWAQHGLAPEADLLPQRDLHWSSAQQYADDAYESFLGKSWRPRRFPCIDDDSDLGIKDTYAFVKLAYQAYNLKTLRKPPDESQVRPARAILEDALAEAREEHRRLVEARLSMAQGGAAPSCLTEVETKAWVKRISSHLKLAEALQP